MLYDKMICGSSLCLLTEYMMWYAYCHHIHTYMCDSSFMSTHQSILHRLRRFRIFGIYDHCAPTARAPIVHVSLDCIDAYSFSLRITIEILFYLALCGSAAPQGDLIMMPCDILWHLLSCKDQVVPQRFTFAAGGGNVEVTPSSSHGSVCMGPRGV